MVDRGQKRKHLPCPLLRVARLQERWPKKHIRCGSNESVQITLWAIDSDQQSIKRVLTINQDRFTGTALLTECSC